MTLNECLLGGNPIHILVLCCFVTFFDFIFQKKKISYMSPNHFVGYVF